MSDARTVWVVDDDEAMRDSLRMLLRATGYQVTVFGSAREFLDDWNSGVKGCLLLDIRMPKMSGLELQQALVDRGIDLPIVFITGHGDVPMAVQAMQKGAAHFLQKPFPDGDLLDAIESAFAAIDDAGASSAEREVQLKNFATLTHREQEVMARVVAGDANKVIAVDLGLSQRTVEVHRSRVMEKMQAHSLADLVRKEILIHGN